LRVVAGLGNPGARYRRTRHNAGFRVVELLASRAAACRHAPEPSRHAAVPSRGVVARAVACVRRLLGGPSRSGPPQPAGLAMASDPEAWLAEVELGAEPFLLLKPLAFMNASGPPIARVLAAAGASPKDLVVVLDDVALELGRVRVRARGRHGGHNGLRSVIAALGTEEFVRVRIGVRSGEPPAELADFVLAELPADEEPAFEETLARAADAVECVLREGPEAAMDRFNGSRA
jgi:peptidyl-tRNA hydrolase, PTH1 family